MTSGRRGRWAAWGAALVVTLSMAWAGSAAAAPVPAVADYGGCLLAHKAGDLMILFDESGSLNNSDRDNARIKAASYLTRQLLRYAQQNEVKLDVAVSGFADGYRQADPWTSLDDAGADAVQQTISTFHNPTSGFETDYWNGLSGAKEALVTKAAGDRGRCQAVVWFTDGKFSLRQRNADQEKGHGARKPYAPDVSLRDQAGLDRAAAAATADLCRNGGLADQLRVRHITLLAMGLKGKDGSDAPFDLMKRVAEAGPSCGNVTQPPGKFWPVTDIDQMLAAFDTVANPRGRRARSFVLDDALNRVHIFGTGRTGLTYTLVSPDHRSLVLEHVDNAQHRATVDRGVNVSWEWLSDKSLAVDLTRGSGSWTGLWRVDVKDPSRSVGPDPTISLSGDLYPAWASGNTAKLYAGDRPRVRLGLVHAKGTPVALGNLRGTASLSATLITSTGDSRSVATDLKNAQIQQPQPLDLRNVPVGPATVRLALTYTTAKVGGVSTTLEPQQVDVPLTILAPPDAGQLSGDFDFGASNRAMDATSSIQVKGPSCVWLDSSKVNITTQPADVTPVAITSEHSSAATCLKVPAGQTAPFPAHLTTAAAGNGSLVGTVQVNQAPPAATDRATAVRIDFGAEMKKPLKVLNFALALIVALVLGPGIPLALLYLAKYLTAKIPGHPLEAVRFPVTVDGDSVLHDGHPLTLEDLPRAQAVDLLRRGSRTATAAGVGLRTRSGRSPFGAGFTEAVLPGAAGVSSTSDHPHGRQQAARLPLAVHNTWAAFVDPAGSAGPAGADDSPAPRGATVLLLRGLDVTTDQRREQLHDVQAQLPGLIRSLRPGPGAPGSPTAPPSGPRGSTAPPAAPDLGGTRGAPGGSPDFDFGFRDENGP